MVSSTRANLTTTYVYDALGQRVKKSSGGDTTYFVYDEAGHLIGEYDSAGELIQEIVWMDDTPVLSIRWSSCGIAVFYIHTDHLNTPRRITKRSSPEIVWRWDSDPFGTTGQRRSGCKFIDVRVQLALPGAVLGSRDGAAL